MDYAAQIGRFFDPLAMLLVFGGAAVAAALRSTRADIAASLRALVPLLRADPQADAAAAMRAVGAIETLAQARSILCADRIETTQPFLRRAARRLSDAHCAADFTHWAAEEIEDRRSRHAAAADVWRALADAAPGLGMIGTIIGLVRMFAAMSDPATIGPAMALAMLTTLYGIVVASLIAGPVAARLDRLSAAEIAWQERALRRLEQLAEREFAAYPLHPAMARATA